MNGNLKISACGDICSECPRYIATMANNISELERIARLWFRLGLRGKVVSPEELKCTGCSKNRQCSHQLNNCIHLANKNNCGECDIFPCGKINSVFNKTDEFNMICKRECTSGEYIELHKAFMMKRQILYGIHEDFKRKNQK